TFHACGGKNLDHLVGDGLGHRFLQGFASGVNDRRKHAAKDRTGSHRRFVPSRTRLLTSKECASVDAARENRARKPLSPVGRGAGGRRLEEERRSLKRREFARSLRKCQTPPEEGLWQ